MRYVQVLGVERIDCCGECRDFGVLVERAVFQIRSAVNGDQFHGVPEVSSETTKRVNFLFFKKLLSVR